MSYEVDNLLGICCRTFNTGVGEWTITGGKSLTRIPEYGAYYRQFKSEVYGNSLKLVGNGASPIVLENINFDIDPDDSL